MQPDKAARAGGVPAGRAGQKGMPAVPALTAAQAADLSAKLRSLGFAAAQTRAVSVAAGAARGPDFRRRSPASSSRSSSAIRRSGRRSSTALSAGARRAIPSSTGNRAPRRIWRASPANTRSRRCCRTRCCSTVIRAGRREREGRDRDDHLSGRADAEGVPVERVRLQGRHPRRQRHRDGCRARRWRAPVVLTDRLQHHLDLLQKYRQRHPNLTAYLLTLK